MKRIILIQFILSLCFYPIMAESVPTANLTTAAVNYMNSEFPNRTFSVATIEREGVAFGMSSNASNALINLISFNSGGWVLMSNDLNAPPLLACSEIGTFTLDTIDKPEALIELLKSYKEELKRIKDSLGYFIQSGSGMPFTANRQHWQNLIDINSAYIQNIKSSATSNLMAQSISSLNRSNLFLSPGRGDEPQWGQSNNNNNGCSPAYNEFMPGSKDFVFGCIGFTGDTCKRYSCNKKPAGCATVAMTQLMRYWQFPPQYEWTDMPVVLTNYTPNREAINIQHLMRDCGDAANVTYCCLGSYTTTNKIVEAFKGSAFPYSSVSKLFKKDVSENYWINTIKGEIDAGRPVIYRGDKNLLSFDKHFWIISGYNNAGLFYCNWGWKGYENGYFYMGNFTPDGSEYNKVNMIVYNIKPSWNRTNDVSLVDVSKYSGEDWRIFARNVQMSNDVLNSGSVTKICATGSITINYPFTVQNGATATFACYNASEEQSAILSVSPQNNQEPLMDYLQENNLPTIVSENLETTPIETDDEIHSTEKENGDKYSEEISVYPNPNNGEFHVKINFYSRYDSYKEIKVFNSNGMLILQKGFSGNSCNISEIKDKGIYILKMYIDDKIFTKRVIVN